MDRILHEVGRYFVLKAPNGYEVYRSGPVAAERVASISIGPGRGLARAVAEANRRAEAEAA